MPTLDLEVTCPVFDSFRVQQVGGMFDVPLAQRATEHFKLELPEWLMGREEGRGVGDGGQQNLPSPFGRGAGGEGGANCHEAATANCPHPNPLPKGEGTDDLPSPHAPRPSPPTWQIGLIVGPSGSGKTTVARALFGDRVYRPRDWPRDRAVIDGFGDRPIKDIAHLLTAVGFSSPPSWIKPYHVLSNGEQFRCDLARALMGDEGRQNLPSPFGRGAGGEGGANCNAASTADCPHPSPLPKGEGTDNLPSPACGRGAGGEGGQDQSQPALTLALSQRERGPDALTLALSQRERGPDAPTVVFDEFTSVVDRNVARVVSAAIAKGIRGGRIGCRFVAVTCHYDIAEWLAPDWVIDMATGTFQRRSLRRPPIHLQLVRCRRSAWRLFARHHYLSGQLPQYVRCFLALWENMPVAFCATVSLIGRKNRWRISRVVTLPDYQGVGIGMAVTEAVAELHQAQGHRVNLTGSHPAVIAHCRRSPQWKTVGVKKTGGPGALRFRNYHGSTGRAVVSFEYVGVRGERSGVRVLSLR